MKPPYEPAPIDRYCRLFPPTDPPFDPKVMEDLGRSMAHVQTPIPREKRGHPLPAGYTYFGQFIDHDLTLDETPLPEAIAYGSIPNQTHNAADGRLNLSHLYGFGPRSVQHRHLYSEDGASFRLEEIETTNGIAFDLPANVDDPQSAETRNTENLILRQLCAMFLKLHNLAVEELSPHLHPIERFYRARNRVCWQYQWLVRKDFLYRIMKPEIYLTVITQEQHEVDWESKGFAIPVEFSQAAFRFGHSMVRAHYDLNRENRKVPLREIFGRRQGEQPLNPSMAVDWSHFLDPSESTATGRGRVPAEPIDTGIVLPLFHLPDAQIHHSSDLEAPPLPPQLAVRTLQRGASSRLACGEEVARAFNCTPIRQGSPEGGERSWKKLHDLGLIGRTPLWYYILLEAELECNGQTLGTVGSRLVAEVIEGSLRTDPNSYVSCFGTAWTPPPWRVADGRIQKVQRLQDIALITGLLKD